MTYTIIVQDEVQMMANRRTRVQTNIMQVSQTVFSIADVIVTLEDLEDTTERIFLDDEIMGNLPNLLRGLRVGQSVMVGIVSNGELDEDGDLIATGTVRVQRAPDDAILELHSPNSTVMVASPDYMFSMEYD
jgi:hypothetical protein